MKNSKTRKKLAIIRLSALGDIIISASILGALKHANKIHKNILNDYDIEWFVDERFSGILRDSTCINTLHALPFKKLLKTPRGILKIYKYCKNCGEYDVVIDMQGLIKSALIGRFLDSKKFVGFSPRGAREKLASIFYTKKVDIDYKENVLRRNLFVLIGGVVDEMDKEFLPLEKTLENILDFRHNALFYDKHKIDNNIVDLFKDCTQCYKFLFILEASIPQKVYPINQYATLARLLANFLESRHIKAMFYFAWNDYEDSANKLLAMLNAQNICSIKLPRLDFNALKYCISHIDCAIGGDTGLTHLSWALGKECITLYGNTNKTSGKNMSKTSINRVVLGNPYILSSSNSFEISSISPEHILKTFIDKIYNKTN